MLYRHWLNLNLNLLWCYNLPVKKGSPSQSGVIQSSLFSNSGAWMVREGWACVEHGGQTYRAEPGQWLILKPTERIQSFAQETRLLSIAFDARWPDGSHLFDEGLSLILNANDYPALESKALPLLNCMMDVNPDTWDARDRDVDLNRYLLLERRLCEWLQALAKALEAQGIEHSGQTAVDERVSRAISLLNSYDLGEQIDMSNIAEQVGLSVNHLSRLFRRDIKASPNEYRERHRIEYAQRHLAQPGCRIKEVAIDLGFKHLSHFSKWFKNHTGVSPRNATQQEQLK